MKKFDYSLNKYKFCYLSKIVKKFKKSNKQIIHIKHPNKLRTRHLYILKNPIRLIFNSLVCLIIIISPPGVSNILMRLVGVKLGKNVIVSFGCKIDPISPELIEIKDNAILGLFCQILNHHFTRTRITIGKVSIGKNALIGHNSFIEPGVKIGDHSTVSRISVVDKSVPERTLVAGNPAKIIRRASTNSIKKKNKKVKKNKKINKSKSSKKRKRSKNK